MATPKGIPRDSASTYTSEENGRGNSIGWGFSDPKRGHRLVHSAIQRVSGNRPSKVCREQSLTSRSTRTPRLRGFADAAGRRLPSFVSHQEPPDAIHKSAV